MKTYTVTFSTASPEEAQKIKNLIQGILGDNSENVTPRPYEGEIIRIKSRRVNKSFRDFGINKKPPLVKKPGALIEFITKNRGNFSIQEKDSWIEVINQEFILIIDYYSLPNWGGVIVKRGNDRYLLKITPAALEKIFPELRESIIFRTAKKRCQELLEQKERIRVSKLMDDPDLEIFK